MFLKILKRLAFSIIFVLMLSIPYSVYTVRLNNKSSMGKLLKENVIRYPQLVKTIDLNEPGDYRYYYADPAKSMIKVRIISVNSIIPDENVNRWLNEIMLESIGKTADIGTTSNITYKRSELLQDEDLHELRRTAESVVGEADLNLIYTNSYSEKPSSVGLVLHRDTIFIFKDVISRLSEKGYVKDVLEKTTIMHEWGHLMGITHVNRDKCIMNETAEVYDQPPIGKTLPMKYCWEELHGFEKI